MGAVFSSSIGINAANAQLVCNTGGVSCTGNYIDGVSPTAGDYAIGSITVDAETILGTERISAGEAPGIQGTINIQNGANWTNQNNFHAGFNGIGTINITGPGTVFTTNQEETTGPCPCPSGPGDGAGSTGTLNVSNGAQLNVLDGPGWNTSQGSNGNGELIVGLFGDGTMNVESGGLATAEAVLISRIAGSAGITTVDGQGSVLRSNTSIRVSEQPGTDGTLDVKNGAQVIISGDTNEPWGWQGVTLSVGEEGAGNLNVTGGGTVTIDRGGVFAFGNSNGISIGGTSVPGAAPGIGNAVVQGSGSRIDISGGGANLLIGTGETGQGSLDILDGGVVSLDFSVAGDATNVMIGFDQASSGRLLVDGAASTLEGGESINCGSFDGSGTMDARDGGTIAVTRLNGQGGYISVDSNCTASGDGVYRGDVIVRGQLQPGTEVPGNLDVDGNVLTDPGGELQFNVSGLLPSERDTLTASGSIDFASGSTCKIVLEPAVTLAQLSTTQLLFGTAVEGITDVVVVDPGDNELARVDNYDVSSTNSCVGALANQGGPTIDSLCPCEGPANTGDSWKNHGKYVSCVAHAAGTLVQLGELDPSETGEVVSAAAQSSCGK